MGRWGWCAAAAALALAAFVALRDPAERGGALALGEEERADSGDAARAVELVESAPPPPLESPHAPPPPDGVAPSAEPRSERESVALDAPDPPRRVRGAVVDAASGAPVPPGLGLAFQVASEDSKSLVTALFGTRALPLGALGEFELESRRPERLRGWVIDATSGERVDPTRHRYAEERDEGGGWRVPLSATWLARLDVAVPSGVEDIQVEGAGLVELVGGVELERDASVLSGASVRAGRPLVVCREAEPESSVASRRWVAVWAQANGSRAADTSSRWTALVEVAPGERFLASPLRVELEPQLFVTGRVVDEHGEPWSEAVVELLPRERREGRAEDLWESTNDRGLFHFEAPHPDDRRLRASLEPGEHRVRVSAAFARGVERTCELRRGDNDLGTLVLPRGGPRGVVRGQLVAPDGAKDGPAALLTLSDAASGVEVQGIAFDLDLFGAADARTGFEMSDVPEGEYELDVLALDGWSYPDAPFRVRVPAPELVIEARGPAAPRWRVCATDARSGEELEIDGVLLQRRGTWIPFEDDDFPDPRGGPIVVFARGHAPLRIESPPALARAQGAERELEVALEPGFGRVVLVREVGRASSSSGEEHEGYLMPPLAGARVLADGRELARSDASGLALVASEPAPGAIAFELPGHRVVSRDEKDGLTLVLMARD